MPDMGDLIVLTDFGILKENFGKSGEVAIPEPSTLLLATLAGLGLAPIGISSKHR